LASKSSGQESAADAESLSYTVLGTPFEITSESPTFTSEIHRLLERFAGSTPAEASHTFVVRGDDTGLTLHRAANRLLSTATLGTVVLRILAEINRTAVEAVAEFSVHASVVADDDRVIVTVADSGGGKSTLAAAFLRTGLRYGSDEALCLDDGGWVVSYPKPITLNRWSWERLGLVPSAGYPEEAPFLASELGAELMESKRRPTHLLLPVITEGHAPAIEPLPASVGVSALIKNSFNHYKNGGRAYRLATELGKTMTTWRVATADPLHTARYILDHLR
jgi:hypothetical protein